MATQPTGFIDFMAFARGAEMAQEANWRDRINQQALDERQQEQAWRELSRQTALPTYQAEHANRLRELQDAGQQRELNQRIAQRTSDIAREAMQYGDEAAGMMGVRYYEALQGATTAQERQALQASGLRSAADFARAGDYQGAEALLTAIGRPDLGQRVASAGQWNDPANFMNPEFVAQAGGILGPDGAVTYQPGGPNSPAVTMPAATFAQFMRQQSLDATRDLAGPLGQASAQQRQRDAWQQYLNELNAAGYPNNIQYRGNPETGAMTMLPIPPVTPGVQNDTARLAATYPAPSAPAVNYSGAPASLAAPAPSLAGVLAGAPGATPGIAPTAPAAPAAVQPAAPAAAQPPALDFNDPAVLSVLRALAPQAQVPAPAAVPQTALPLDQLLRALTAPPRATQGVSPGWLTQPGAR